ncbi:hypothetical protein BCR37DRAFT_383548 [Protomyces lactucae-debilis]|uniref:Secreted protein n=1 Tax=Protomyces lactucae-debilis TaxID=2754530 RepID=A0A1Y2EXR0_PROLT|nr:uncharacterized protein BCR37DRAFT_383548 [Protomyces lactucae-debilis]ORY76402.1 hypothetical protein BCR37DRAFT_383548 [Protomyces lactucae-debilis]
MFIGFLPAIACVLLWHGLHSDTVFRCPTSPLLHLALFPCAQPQQPSQSSLLAIMELPVQHLQQVACSLMATAPCS